MSALQLRLFPSISIESPRFFFSLRFPPFLCLDSLQSAPKARPKCPKAPESAPKVPESAPKVPRSVPKVPQSALKVPQSAPKCPQSALKVPQSAPKVPQSAPKVPQSALKVPQSADRSGLSQGGPRTTVSLLSTLLRGSVLAIGCWPEGIGLVNQTIP